MKRICLMTWLLAASGAAAQEPQVPPPPAADVKPDTAPAAPAARDPQFQTMDRLELGTTSITGNQELPKVMYVVPWKKAELGDLSGRPARSLIDEILAPVDRDVFRREVGYFETLSEEIQGSATQGENPVTPQAARP
jgi:hypothetical protein